VQVADRFHLLQNLREALQRVLEQHLGVIQAAQPCVLIYRETDRSLQFVCNGREKEPFP
jgi:hypothetical protein